MQLKTLTLVAASLAVAQARVNGTWGDNTKAPVLDTTTTPYKPTTKPVDGGKTDVADETASSTTWDDADLPSSTKPVDGGKTDVADSTTQSYWGDETDVADSTVASSTTWADLTSVADSTTTPAATYWGDETSVADLSSTTHWSDFDVTTSEETKVIQITKTYTKGDGSKVTTTEVNTKTITHTVYVTPTPVSGGEGKPPGGGAGGPPKETPVLGGEGDGCGVVTVTNTVVKTITVPAGGKPTPAPPAPTTPVVVISTTEHTWADVPAPSDAPAAPVSGGYMGIVETWRSKMGLSQLQLDSKLQSNAQDAANSSGGQLKHKLNPGSMAQVMAPGDSGNFESVFVGGWLCELPSTPGLGSSVCNEMSKGWNYAGQTGHAEILTAGKYSKIGCALGDGIWCCDLA